jgi:hypothetical protein
MNADAGRGDHALGAGSEKQHARAETLPASIDARSEALIPDDVSDGHCRGDRAALRVQLDHRALVFGDAWIAHRAHETVEREKINPARDCNVMLRGVSGFGLNAYFCAGLRWEASRYP